MPDGILGSGRRRPRPGARPRARAVALDWGIFSQHFWGASIQPLQEVTANAAFEALDASANAAIANAMGDANITLTDAQALRAGLVTLTGSNTAVRKVTMPSKARRLAIQNSTGGALDITVGYATGATVTVGNGAIVLIQGNGTNCYGVGGCRGARRPGRRGRAVPQW